jgi:hypothetical protein
MQVGWYDRKICRVRDLSCGDTRIFLELEVRRLDCRNCGKVKRERLDFLADNPHYTKRFAYYVGRRCRAATIKDVAADLKLDWHTVKTLDQQYMEAQLARAGTPGPQVIGIDEIAIRRRSPIRPSPTLSSIGSCTMRTDSHSRARACEKRPPSTPDLTSSRTHEPMRASTGAAVRLHRNAVRNRPDSLSAFKWNDCPPSPESARRASASCGVTSARLGAALLRELACKPQVAAAQTL